MHSTLNTFHMSACKFIDEPLVFNQNLWKTRLVNGIKENVGNLAEYIFDF